MNAPPPYQPPPQGPYPPNQPPPAQGYAPPPGQGPGPKKSGGKGCLIALAIVGGVILLVGATGAFLAYRFASSPDGKKLVSAVASGAALATEAATAPGTSELRALGCTSAMVFDTAKVAAIATSLRDGGKVKTPHDEQLSIACATNRGAAAPTCDQVAATYVAAVGRAAGTFGVSVGATGQRATCEEIYSAAGERLAQGGDAPP